MANSEWRIEGGYGLLPNSLFAIRCSLVFEFVVGAGAGALRGDTALEELWRVLALARLARLAWLARCALGRIAADLRLQLDDVDELVGLAAQLVGHRGGRGGGG